MASMLITKSAIFHLSKVLPHSLRSSTKPSRVFFVSASNNSDWRNATEGASRDSRANWCYDSAKNRDSDVAERAKETMREGKEMAKDYADSTREKTKEMAERAKEYGRETKDEAKEAAEVMAEKAKEGTNRAAEKAGDATEKAKEYAYDTKESAKETAGAVADKTREGGYRAADTAETMTDKAAETAKNAEEMAKETVKGAWGMAKDTTQKIKETVVGKDDDYDDDDDKDETAKVMDETVTDLRKKTRNKNDETLEE